MSDYEATRTLDTFEIPNIDNQEKNAKRRRKLADDLLAQSQSSDIGQGYQGGRIYIVGNPLGNVAKAIGGAYMSSKADEADQTEAEQVQSVRKELLNRMSPEQRSAAEMALTPGMEELGKASYASSLKGDLDKAFTLSEGQQRFDKDGKPIASVAAKPEQQPPSVREFQYAQLEGFKGSYRDWLRQKTDATTRIHVSSGGVGSGGGFGGTAPVIGADEQGNPIYRHTKSGKLFQYDDIGAPRPYQGAVGAKPAVEKPMTEGQSKDALFGSRMAASDKILGEVSDYSPMKIDLARAAEKLPGGMAAGNALLPEGEQQVYQAQRDFLNAVLRKESGAVISDQEFDNARKQYFPVPGDKPATLAQKKANRQLAIEGLKLGTTKTGKAAIEQQQGARKTVGGKNYVKQNGKWYEE